MTPQEHARDLMLRLSAINPTGDDIPNLLVHSFEAAMKDERERIERRYAVASHPGWQPMDSAPKDGRDVYMPIKADVQAYWCKDLLRWVLSRPLHMEFVRDPRGWRPTGNPLPSETNKMPGADA